MKVTQRLELADAQKMVAAANAESQRRGFAVSVAVCDDSGRLVLFQRGDEATGITVDLAPAKARATALLGLASAHMEKALNEGYTALATLPGGALLGGGVPIRVDGHLLGAIAVSGASTGALDAELAQVGIDALGHG